MLIFVSTLPKHTKEIKNHEFRVFYNKLFFRVFVYETTLRTIKANVF